MASDLQFFETTVTSDSSGLAVFPTSIPNGTLCFFDRISVCTLPLIAITFTNFYLAVSTSSDIDLRSPLAIRSAKGQAAAGSWTSTLRIRGGSRVGVYTNPQVGTKVTFTGFTVDEAAFAKVASLFGMLGA